MVYKSLKECVLDLEKNGHLTRVKEEVDPNLEMAEIQRRVYQVKGPALFFENVKGSPFPAVSNLFGTLERCRFIFRSTLKGVKKLIEMKTGPFKALKSPLHFRDIPSIALKALPKKVSGGPILQSKTTINQLPQIKCWPDDGGAFITLPQVYTEDQYNPGIMHSNLGMYRIQMSGNQYQTNQQVGLHYQIHRGIGVHHAGAIQKGEPLRVSIFVGGPPAHTFAAVMPLPEGVPEVAFAGALGGRRFRYAKKDGYTISTDADFCITGTIDPEKMLREGPFGDHLGYYSLAHDFPYLKVDSVYHRRDAIWPFTVVGRPPQEDTTFGELIHEITEPLVPKEIPGLKAVHAVDAAGVHPLLLAIGSERYVPYEKTVPQEILTIANAILGVGQTSLAKYLMIMAGEDNPDLNISDIKAFFMHLLERIDWKKDLHFQTRTTIDTLDYSGTGLNEGSKVVMAAAGAKKRDLSAKLPKGFTLPDGFQKPAFIMPGILIIEAAPFKDYPSASKEIAPFTECMKHRKHIGGIPLFVLVDDSEFSSRTLNHFLWITFTRSNPSHDIYGVESFLDYKHWGCKGPLVIDARIKPHHSPPLIEDPEITKRVDALSLPGRRLHAIL